MFTCSIQQKKQLPDVINKDDFFLFFGGNKLCSPSTVLFLGIAFFFKLGNESSLRHNGCKGHKNTYCELPLSNMIEILFSYYRISVKSF